MTYDPAVEQQMAVLHSGKFYNAMDDAIVTYQRQCMQAMYEFNQSNVLDQARRQELQQEMFGSCGSGTYVEPPMYANWGGHHVRFGKNCYANFGLTVVDDTYIDIEDNVLIGPHVTIATALHPENPEFRRQGYQRNLPVKICRGVWIGANVTICPGVTIGADSIIGAGSVVNKDIPSGVLGVGVPCRVLRELKQEDRELFSV